MPHSRNSKLARKHKNEDCSQDSEVDYYVPKTLPEAKLRAVSEEYRRRQFNPEPSWRLHKEEDTSPERDLDTPGSGYRPRGRGGRPSYWVNKRADPSVQKADTDSTSLFAIICR